MESGVANGRRPIWDNTGDRMARRKKVYEGKAKILYEGPEPGTLIQYFKDDVQVDATPPQGAVEGKGVLNNRLSEFFMAGLNSIGVPTHFIKRLNMREQMVRMAEILPLEIVVRNYAAGAMTERLGIPLGTALPRPIVEYYFKDEKLGNPLVSEEHIVAFGWGNQQDLDDIIALALRVNDFLTGVMLGAGVRLADFRLEVGRVWEGEFMRLIVADEISPDSCRLWDIRGLDLYEREDQGRDPVPLAEVYTELARRLGVLPSNVTHTTKPTLIN
jgi:phosphoribosylaminoimidazole-succinocarboxamide synthase